jgi:hypothetical protein
MADRIDNPGSSPATLNLRRLEHIRVLLQYAALVVLLVFIGLIVFSYFQLRGIKREITEQQALIDKQKQEMKANEATLADQKKLMEAQSAVISVLQRPTLAATEANPSEGARTREEVEDSLPKVNDVRQLPARIYMQIARADQRRRAAVIARQLQAWGYIVPGIENVRDKAPTNSQLRYCDGANYLPSDLDGITKALERISVTVTRQRLQRCANVRPRHYEIWLGESF